MYSGVATTTNNKHNNDEKKQIIHLHAVAVKDGR
jgi:hypothetical protein